MLCYTVTCVQFLNMVDNLQFYFAGVPSNLCLLFPDDDVEEFIAERVLKSCFLFNK